MQETDDIMQIHIDIRFEILHNDLAVRGVVRKWYSFYFDFTHRVQINTHIYIYHTIYI